MTNRHRPSAPRCQPPHLQFVFAAVLLAAAPHSLSAAPDDVDSPEIDTAVADNAPADHLISWFTSLDTAKEQARIRRAPILIKFGAVWCGYCQQLDDEIESSVLQDELQRWLPVSIDVERQSRVARDLGIGPIPALRVLTPDGRLVASHDGYLPADDLARWLADQHDLAALGLGDELSGDGPPSATAVVRIVREFDRRDATLREAAIARLAPYPEKTAVHVLAKFHSGTLSEKLTARELLLTWNAPVDDLDPWQPNTFNDDRVARLDQWLAKSDFSVPEGQSLTPSQFVEAERLLRMMTTADAAAAASMREQLARMGNDVLPLIREAIRNAPGDTARARLTAARYRLAASGALVVAWPGGIERLASQNFQERIAAVDELADRATSDEENLLLALFSDPAPIVREVALRALRRTSGQQADSALVRLLDDPDANVRAAVLKELAESPSLHLVPKIADYVKREQDPDLVVHAARFLSEVKAVPAVSALLGLFNHPSWRVRAEAAEGVAQLAGTHQLRSKLDTAGIQDAFIQLLGDEDSFVASRAAAGLGDVTTARAFDPLIETTKAHPQLTPEIVPILLKHSVYREKAFPILDEYSRHELSHVRAAAIAGLIGYKLNEIVPRLEQALDDENLGVRIAAIDTVFARLGDHLVPHPVNSPTGANVITHFSRTGSAEEPVVDVEIDLEPTIEVDVETAVETEDEVETEELTESDASQPDRTDSDGPSQPAGPLLKIPKWFAQAEPLLLPLLEAENIEERVSAARVLALAGHAEAVDVLTRSAGEPGMFEKIAECLPKIKWDDRRTLFDALTTATTSGASRTLAVEKMTDTFDMRTSPVLWELLARPDADQRLASELLYPLMRAYFGEQNLQLDEASPEAKQRCTADCERYAAEGTPWQRILALMIVTEYNREAAVLLAESVFGEAALAWDMRVKALNVLLYCLDESAAIQRSVALLDHDEHAVARTGLAYLALGDEGLAGVIEETRFSQNWTISHQIVQEPIVPEPPDDVTAKQLAPFRDSTDVHEAAQAGYLLVLLGEAGQLPRVIAGWEASPQEDAYRRIAYRAIASLNHNQSVPVLEEIYNQLGGENASYHIVQEFYWTIRTMTGSQVLALRKQIRQDHWNEAFR